MENTFAKFLRTDEIVLKHAKGMRDVYGREMHSYYEIFYLVSGDADFVTDNGKFRLEPSAAVIIPKGTYHQFVVYCDEADYERVIFHFDGVTGLDKLIEMKTDRLLFVRSEKISSLFAEAKALIGNPLPELETGILLKSLLAQITVNIGHENSVITSGIEMLDPVTEKIVAYVNGHIADDLSLPAIAKSLFMSESYISHIFRQDMKISLHKYILQKRLILANHKIGNGASASSAAAECGFRDYSAFYRQYKAMFDVCPSETEK